MVKPCSCGSGRARYEMYDAANIFLCFYCDECEAEKRKRYNPRIFDQSSPYASSGDERDLLIDYEAERY